MHTYVHDVNGWMDIFGLSSITKTVDFVGHSDLFSISGSQKNIVTIVLTGDRGSDFTRAFKEAGISKSEASGYTWHHVADFDSKKGTSTMQLIKTSTHEASLPHKGSAGQFAEYFGVEYDTFEAKMKAFEQGWRKKTTQRDGKKTAYKKP